MKFTLNDLLLASVSFAGSAAFFQAYTDGYFKLPISESTKLEWLEHEVIEYTADTHINGATYEDLMEILLNEKEKLRQAGYTEEQQITAISLNRTLSILDPHSSFTTDFKGVRERIKGSFGGIGILYSSDAPAAPTQDGIASKSKILLGGLFVTGVVSEKTPAAKAGLQKGDIITHIDGQSLAGMPVDNAASLLKGNVGTQITLSVQRLDALSPLEISLRRETIAKSPVFTEMKADNTGYIKISAFNSLAFAELESSIKTLEAEGAQRYILDLLDNPGGLVSQSASVSDGFLDGSIFYPANGVDPTTGNPKPNVMIHQRTVNDKKPTHFAKVGSLTDAPLVVLVNQRSASASEIVAGILQAYGRATIVGTPTFGKGTGQTIREFDVDFDNVPDGVARVSSFAYYYGPGDGINLQHKGISPDILISDEFTSVSTNPTQRRESILQSSISAPDDSNYKNRTTHICKPANTALITGAFNLSSNPWIDCAMAVLNGMQSDSVTIEPINVLISTNTLEEPAVIP